MKYNRKIRKNGGALSINIPKDVANHLNWVKDTPIILTVNDKTIIVEGDKDGV